MQSIKSRVFYHLVKYQLSKLARLSLPLPEYRLAREAAASRIFKMPSGISVEACSISYCEGEWLRRTEGTSKGIVLYLHGGAYTGGSCITHRALAATIAKMTKANVFNLGYRLAPEHPFPAALEDAVRTYQAISNKHPQTPIAICGDSAGAGLALATAIELRDQQVNKPVCLALMSPWTDLALTNETHRTKAAVDPYFPTTERLTNARHYAGDTELTHPLISPQYATVHDLPPTLIHVGSLEALLQDSLTIAANMTAQGSNATVKIFPGMWHVWQTLHSRIKEADQSLEELAEFMQTHFVSHAIPTSTDA